MANNFSVGDIVTIQDGQGERDAQTYPPPGSRVRVTDVPDGTQGLVIAVWQGGEIYSVSFRGTVNGAQTNLWTAFAESELA